MASSETGGVKAFPISGRMVRERERLLGMTDQERAWRRQWLKDQELTKNEPRVVPELQRELMNPIRRFYRFPLDRLREVLAPRIGPQAAFHVRYWTGKAVILLFTVYSVTYYFKYNANDWTKKGGWRVFTSRTAVNKGDPEFPKLSDRSQPSDYAERGFKKSVI